MSVDMKNEIRFFNLVNEDTKYFQAIEISVYLL